MRSDSKAIIVGGGHNGLVCAFYLARAGFNVSIYEKNNKVGATFHITSTSYLITNLPMRRKYQMISLYLSLFGLAFLCQMYLCISGYRIPAVFGTEVSSLNQAVTSIEQNLAQNVFYMFRLVISYLF